MISSLITTRVLMNQSLHHCSQTSNGVEKFPLRFVPSFIQGEIFSLSTCLPVADSWQEG